MPRYYFPIFHKHVQPDNEGLELADRHAAWEQATKTAGEVLKDIDGNLHLGDEWRLEVEDEFRQPLFAIRVNAEKG